MAGMSSVSQLTGSVTQSTCRHTRAGWLVIRAILAQHRSSSTSRTWVSVAPHTQRARTSPTRTGTRSMSLGVSPPRPMIWITRSRPRRWTRSLLMTSWTLPRTERLRSAWVVWTRTLSPMSRSLRRRTSTRLQACRLIPARLWRRLVLATAGRSTLTRLVPTATMWCWLGRWTMRATLPAPAVPSILTPRSRPHRWARSLLMTSWTLPRTERLRSAWVVWTRTLSPMSRSLRRRTSTRLQACRLIPARLWRRLVLATAGRSTLTRLVPTATMWCWLGRWTMRATLPAPAVPSILTPRSRPHRWARSLLMTSWTLPRTERLRSAWVVWTRTLSPMSRSLRRRTSTRLQACRLIPARLWRRLVLATAGRSTLTRLVPTATMWCWLGRWTMRATLPAPAVPSILTPRSRPHRWARSLLMTSWTLPRTERLRSAWVVWTRTLSPMSRSLRRRTSTRLQACRLIPARLWRRLVLATAGRSTLTRLVPTATMWCWLGRWTMRATLPAPAVPSILTPRSRPHRWARSLLMTSWTLPRTERLRSAWVVWTRTLSPMSRSLRRRTSTRLQACRLIPARLWRRLVLATAGRSTLTRLVPTATMWCWLGRWTMRATLPAPAVPSILTPRSRPHRWARSLLMTSWTLPRTERLRSAWVVWTRTLSPMSRSLRRRTSTRLQACRLIPARLWRRLVLATAGRSTLTRLVPTATMWCWLGRWTMRATLPAPAVPSD